MIDFTLISPPKGKSLADDYAEHTNQWVEKKLLKSVSEIECHRQLFVGRLSKEQMDVLKDIAKIKSVQEGKKDIKNPVNASSISFLCKEKKRLQKLKEISDSGSDDSSSLYSVEDDEKIAFAEVKNKLNSTILEPNSRKLSAKKSSCEERLRDTRISNLLRRYSAQVRTVNRRNDNVR